MQNAVVEHKVGIIILVVNDNALLSGLKAETLAKFENKLLQMTDESFLQVMFVNYILCLKSKKLECERLTYLQLCRIVTLYGRERKQLLGIGANASPYI